VTGIVRRASCVVPAVSIVLVAICAAAPLRLYAQQPRPAPQPVNPLQRAFDLERRGSYSPAAEAYRGILRTDAADQSALLGLERSLSALERVAEMVPEVRAGLALRPSPPLYALALRVWAAAGQPDSMRVTAERWAAGESDKMVPYRDWGDLLLQRRDLSGARRAYTLGRTVSGKPEALAAELAQVSQLQGDLAGSAREWLLAQKLSPGYRAAAVSALMQAPERQREEVLRALQPEAGGDGAFIAAVLLAQWGDPLRGADHLRRAVAAAATNGRTGVELVAGFIEQVRALGTRDARRALGQSLELLAERQASAPAARTRLEAARAYADGGDPASARRMLALIAADHDASGELATQAVRTLLEVQIAAGEPEEAEATLTARGDLIPAEDRAILRRRLALGWMRRGELARADRLVANDSTVDGAALAGRLALLRGDLRGARTLFQEAGPYAGTRAESTERTALLALIQPIEADSLPLLGTALLALERGDTVAAIAGLDRAAQGLEAKAGAAQIGLLAAQIEWARGGMIEAERRFKLVAATEVAATAPAAELDLARLLVGLRRNTEALAQLEHLILTYPRSALIPQARRLMDEVRGAIPTT
jgi:tetratricopeptide (TPR) repeat protein